MAVQADPEQPVRLASPRRTGQYWGGDMFVRPRTRRHFLLRSAALAGIGLLTGCGVFPSPAQQTAKVPRVGWLSPGSGTSDENFVASFHDGLREIGGEVG